MLNSHIWLVVSWIVKTSFCHHGNFYYTALVPGLTVEGTQKIADTSVQRQPPQEQHSDQHPAVAVPQLLPQPDLFRPPFSKPRVGAT